MINLVQIIDSGSLFDNHYQLIRKIGGGGFSEVWLAHDTIAEMDVALKIYTPTDELDESGKNDFKREFARLCDLNHSNIIHAIGFGIYKDELPYLAMSVCKNGSAKRLIGKATEGDVWNFIDQVSAGLQYLHKKGIVHQDMKPDNVLINSDGTYLIIDFGISTKTRNTLRKSNNGAVSGGTSWYMSIESFGKESPSIYARDIWALGAMLYEIMTGDVPFGQYGGVTQKANKGRIPAIKQNFSPELKQLVYDCLALNAWDRPDATEIRKRVEQHKAGIKPKPASRKNEWIYAALGLVVVFGGFLGWRYVSPASRENIANAVNKNDSILLAEVSIADSMVHVEGLKDKELVNETNLCSAAEIYKEAINRDATDSIIQQGKQMWASSQEIIDEAYTYLHNKEVEYREMGAESAAENFEKRCASLRNYTSNAIAQSEKRAK
jgi:serine/threonine protein kinase